MNIFSTIFSTLFLILGAFIWIVAMLIVLVGSIGILRIVVRQVFSTDVVEWFATYKSKKERIEENERS